ALDQARTELAEYGVVEAWIGEGEAERVLPIDPAPHGVRRLPVGQVLRELQHGGEREPPRCRRGLAAPGEEGRELAVLVDRPERVGDAQAERAFGEGGAGDAAGLVERRGWVFRMQRHRPQPPTGRAHTIAPARRRPP